MKNTKVFNLVKQISEYSQKYYDGNPVIDDIEFDKLIEQLRAIDPENIILKTPGWGYKPAGKEKIPHSVKISGLQKINIVDLTQNTLNHYSIITPKLDGGSVVCYYKNGILDRIVSRGDGTTGLDVTSNLIHAVPSIIEDPIAKEIAIRGEVVLTWHDFDKMEDKGSHPRNSAVGLSQSKHSNADTRLLHVITYSIISVDSGKLPAKSRQLSLLENWGFEVVKHVEIKYLKFPIDKQLMQVIGLTKDGYDIPNDGIVLSCEDTESLAVKFIDDKYITTIKDIVWQFSRTGRAVPVAVVEPIDIDGAMIGRVTCHNYGFVLEHGLGVGAEIEIVRANQVIPKVVGVIKKATNVITPTKCEVCGTKLITTDTELDLLCPNPECSGKLDMVVYKILELVKPDGIGTVNLEELINEFKIWEETKVYTLKDLFIYTLKDLFNGVKFITSNPEEVFIKNYGQHTGKLIFKMLQDLKTLKPTVKDICQVANIPYVGDSASDNLNSISSKEFINKMNTMSFNVNDYSDWRSYFPTEPSFNNFVTYSGRIREVLSFFNNSLAEPVKIVENTIKAKVAITGALSIGRSEWEKSHPMVKVGSVDKTTEYLITNELSESSKSKKAKEYGTKIVSEADFEKIYAAF